MSPRVLDSPVLQSTVVRGLFRVWVVATLIWAIGALILGLRDGGVISARLIGTAFGLPLVLLLGAAGTVWIVRGFQRGPNI